jgi:hypothetical protein
MEHGASPGGDAIVLFITNKAFRIDYVNDEAEVGPSGHGGTNDGGA